MTALTPTRTTSNGTRTRGLPGWTADIDRMFEDLFTSPVKSSSGARITENEDSFEWSVDMPGVDRENIDVKVDENDMVHVSTSYEDSDENHRRSYSYSVRLGNSVDTSGITAEYENGVLTLRLPKHDPEENVRQIEVT